MSNALEKSRAISRTNLLEVKRGYDRSEINFGLETLRSKCHYNTIRVCIEVIEPKT